MDRSAPEYAEAYGKNRQNMIFGLPVGLLVLIVGTVQGITWLWIVGAVVLLLAAANLILMGRMKPTPKG